MPTSAPTQSRRTPRLSSQAPRPIADTTTPHSATWTKAASSPNHPWAKASASSSSAAVSPGPPPVTDVDVDLVDVDVVVAGCVVGLVAVVAAVDATAVIVGSSVVPTTAPGAGSAAAGDDVTGSVWMTGGCGGALAAGSTSA